MHRLHLPIASPCHEDWDAMHTQSDAKRFCDQCSKSVHDLSSMTQRAARDLLDAPRDGRICIRYRTTPTGHIRFADPQVQAPSPRRFAGWRASLAAAAATFALAGCADANRAPDQVTETHCNYDVGPFGYTLQRGEGTCPPIDAVTSHQIDDPQIMGKVALDPEPLPVTGELVAVEPAPVPEMGEEPAIPMGSPPPLPEPSVMGQRTAPQAAPEPVEPVEPVIMGDWAGPEPGLPQDAPCDPEPADANLDLANGGTQRF